MVRFDVIEDRDPKGVGIAVISHRMKKIGELIRWGDDLVAVVTVKSPATALQYSDKGWQKIRASRPNKRKEN